MKRIIILFGMLLMAFVFFIFNNAQKGEPYIEGYVVEKGIERLLVVNGITEEEAKEITQEEIVGIGGVEAIWVSIKTDSQFKKGEKVRVWISGPIAESYPAQAKADHVEIVKTENKK